jgi:flagellar M-ring protein FliF
MDFLNKAFAQLSELFRSMTVGARVTSALLLIAVVVSLVWLFQYGASGPSAYLMNGEVFTPEQQRKMEAALGKAKLKDYRWEGQRLCVPQAQQGVFMAALAENDAMPEIVGGALKKMLDKTSGPFTDPKQRETMIRVATEEDLSGIISWMRGIQRADVKISAPGRATFTSESTTTASVSIVPEEGRELSVAQAQGICVMVAGAIGKGCPVENVSVIDLKSGRGAIRGKSRDATGGSDEYLDKQRDFEEKYTHQILAALDWIKGVRANTTVLLDPDQFRTREYKPDAKVAPLRETEESNTKNSEGPAIGGTAGAVANAKAALAPTTSRGSRTDEEKSKRTAENLVGGTEKTTVRLPLTPKRVKASVSIPMSHFKSVWLQRNPVAAGATATPPKQTDLDPIILEETKKVELLVNNLLEPVTDPATDGAKPVVVTTFDDFPPEEIPVPGFPAIALDWLGRHWSTLGLGFLALISLVMLRSMVRTTPASDAREKSPAAATAAAGAAATAEGAAETEKKEEDPERRLKRLTGTGKSLRDELSEVVSEDPEAAANILRTWIGSAT